MSQDTKDIILSIVFTVVFVFGLGFYTAAFGG